LLGTYSYDGELGEITRKVWEVKGPKNTGALGTLSERGDWLLVVAFEGKSWTLRMARLAIFLETGEQYYKVEFRDGDSSNLVRENLIPLGKPVANAEEHAAQVSGVAEGKVEKFKAMREELAREREARVSASVETKRVEKEKKRQEKEDSEGETLSAIEARDEAQRKLSVRMEHYYRGILVPPQEPIDGTPPFMDELREIGEPFRVWEREERFKTGLFTCGGMMEAQQFLEDCNVALGRKTSQELLAEATQADFDSLGKVAYDRFFAVKVIEWLRVGDLTSAGAEAALWGYEFRGARFSGKYGTVPEKLMEELRERSKECYERNGWTGGKRPWTEEESARYREASRIYEEKRERVDAGESFLDDLSQ